MKRVLISFMILGLFVGSVATAEAKKGKKPARVERTVEGSYGPYPAPVTGCNEPLGSWACLIIETRTTERFFTAKVTDAHGQPVFVEVRRSEESGGGLVAIFCGETTEPIAINRRPAFGAPSLYFYLGLNNWPPDAQRLDCPANRIKTTGTISVTLSNLP